MWSRDVFCAAGQLENIFNKINPTWISYKICNLNKPKSIFAFQMYWKLCKSRWKHFRSDYPGLSIVVIECIVGVNIKWRPYLPGAVAVNKKWETDASLNLIFGSFYFFNLQCLWECLTNPMSTSTFQELLGTRVREQYRLNSTIHPLNRVLNSVFWRITLPGERPCLVFVQLYIGSDPGS